mgnify:CR=1 FL=1
MYSVSNLPTNIEHKVNKTSQQYDGAIQICRDLFSKKTKDYGTAWRVLRLPSAQDAGGKAMGLKDWFGGSKKKEQFREAVAAMKEAGWEIASHGYRWHEYKDYPEALERAQAARRNLPSRVVQPEAVVELRVTITEGMHCQFACSSDGEQFVPAGVAFTAKPGRWVGATTPTTP